MTEAEFWTDRVRPLLVTQCRLAGLRSHFERVENAVAIGTPDVDYCVAGAAGKIELKYSPKHPIRDSTPVLGRGRGLRRSQIVWAARRLFAGGRVFVCVGTPKATWLVDLRRLTIDVWPLIELYTASGLGQISAWHSYHRMGSTLPLALTGEAVPWLPTVRHAAV